MKCPLSADFFFECFRSRLLSAYLQLELFVLLLLFELLELFVLLLLFVLFELFVLLLLFFAFLLLASCAFVLLYSLPA